MAGRRNNPPYVFEAKVCFSQPEALKSTLPAGTLRVVANESYDRILPTFKMSVASVPQWELKG